MNLLKARFAQLTGEESEAGMSTAEYAMGTLAAVALAGTLLKIVGGAKVTALLTAVIERALS